VPAGGPDGGDGGRGGDVVAVADSQDPTLAAFRHRRRFHAGNGRPGEGGRRTGHDGDTVVVHVPPGTVIREGGTLLADLDRPGSQVVLAEGGRGGRGNARFASATRQSPRLGELGEPGGRRRLHLELKLIADIGLVGLPNAGKSSLLRRLTGARPKVAEYPFTTLHPNLGVAEVEGQALVLADVPGLIEGAHRGAGLGLEFLRHVERTRVLVHVVDVSLGAAEARQALALVDEELRRHSEALAQRPRLIALNKVDLEGGAQVALALRDELPAAFAVSALDGTGCQELLEAAAAVVREAQASALAAAAPPAAPSHRLYAHRPRQARAVVSREDGAFRVSGAEVERRTARTDMDSEEAVARLQHYLRRSGVDAALAAAGCVDGDTVRIGDSEFEYRDGPAG
jgi:GTPase